MLGGCSRGNSAAGKFTQYLKEYIPACAGFEETSRRFLQKTLFGVIRSAKGYSNPLRIIS